MTTGILDEPLLTDSRPRLEVLKASEFVLRAQESLYKALLHEAQQDVRHQNFTAFVPAQRELLAKIQARDNLRRALREIFNHVVKSQPGATMYYRRFRR
jgi:hypothetical protein